jgi:Cu-Zn family superoxide dismutase
MRYTFKQLIISGAIGLAGGLFLGSSYYYYSPFFSAPLKAVAIIHPTKGNAAAGTVTFTEQPDGMAITARVTGLPPGKHGFHIHEFGNCACDDALCAGDHFNPEQLPHGGPDDLKRHAGDLGNIVAAADSTATYEAVDKRLTLRGPHSIIGRSIIVHAGEDDLVSQPSGNAGARIGAGVIGLAGK